MSSKIAEAPIQPRNQHNYFLRGGFEQWKQVSRGWEDPRCHESMYHSYEI